MRFDLHLRTEVNERLRGVAKQMGAWEHAPRLSTDDEGEVRRRICGFAHTTSVPPLRFAGVDGSGDFPCLTYSDSFVYLSVAASACYETDTLCGLREFDAQLTSLAEFTWLPGDHREAQRQWDLAFSMLAGAPVVEVIEQSDYRHIKAVVSGRASDVATLARGLLRPKASDTGNVGIQLRSCAELGAALRVLRGPKAPDLLAIDGTFSLPMVARDQHSLFHEHLKRLCATEARSAGVAFVAVSKSHGLPGVEEIERIAAEVTGTPSGMAEHWYLRLPLPGEGWSLPVVDGRQLPRVTRGNDGTVDIAVLEAAAARRRGSSPLSRMNE